MSEGDLSTQTGGGIGRYLRLLRAFARFGLLSELAFRANFLAKVTVEVVWLSLLLVFYHSVFRQTSRETMAKSGISRR